MRFHLTRGDAFLAEWANDARAAGPRRCGGLRLRRFLQGTGSHAASPGAPTRGRGPSARSRSRSGSSCSCGSGRRAAGPSTSGAGPDAPRGARGAGLTHRPVPQSAARPGPRGVASPAGGRRGRGLPEGQSRAHRQGLESALQGKSWNDSVKALAALPDVLRMLSDHQDWARDIGTAYRTQRDSLLFAVQQLRSRAMEAGNLKSSSQQTVKVEPPAAAADGADHHHPHRAGAAAGRLRAGLQPDGGVRDVGVPGVSTAAGVSAGVRRRGGGHQLQHRVRHRLELLALPALSTVSTPASLPATSSAAAWRLEGRGDPDGRVAGERGRGRQGGGEDPAAPRLARSPRGPAAAGRPQPAGTQPARPGAGGTARRPAAASATRWRVDGPGPARSPPARRGGTSPSPVPQRTAAAGGGDRGWGGAAPPARPAPGGYGGMEAGTPPDARRQQPWLDRLGPVGGGGGGRRR